MDRQYSKNVLVCEISNEDSPVKMILQKLSTMHEDLAKMQVSSVGAMLQGVGGWSPGVKVKKEEQGAFFHIYVAY